VNWRHLPLILAGVLVLTGSIGVLCAQRNTVDGDEYSAGTGPVISVGFHAGTSKASLPAPNWIDQSRAAAAAKSAGCLECHQGIEPMHSSSNVVLGCTDCHGGSAALHLTKDQAHVLPLNKDVFVGSANPPNANVVLNHESPEFIRFINPGDLRVAQQACGLCHGEIVNKVIHSMMNDGPMLWGAALYNNGDFYLKNYVFGQAYGPHGEPLTLLSPVPVTPEDTERHGILPFIEPLPRFNLSEPGNILRIFERGGESQLTLGIPTQDEEPGKPANRLSERGLGTLNRTDPVFLGIQKTRLHDPLLGFMGSNDHPGDYRSSGCSACHVVYANDRSPTNSGWWSEYGNQGLSFTADPTIPKNEHGHPIFHQFTRSIPSSQCMNCHMHQGNAFVNPYLGYTWWDQETDGEFMYPKVQKNVTDAQLVLATRTNPEAAAARGLWGDLDFLQRVAELNPKLQHTQFADYHGHGWVFRAVFKKDREGRLLDLDDKVIPDNDPQKFCKAVHLKDVHLADGMQCVDCHFDTDVHGNGLLYGETRNATAIMCVDCHGTIYKRPTLVTSGNAGQFDLNQSVTPWGPRFQWIGNKLYQNSAMEPDIQWEIPQTMDVVDPTSSHYNAKARYAKTLQRDGTTWGIVPIDERTRQMQLAHDNSKMDCVVCHTSWATSCFGCHLPMKANQRVPLNKFEGVTDRNFTTYNPQVLRDDVFMIGRDSTVKGNRLAVIRSSSAVVVGSQNSNREWVYSQQQTVSAEGYSGQAFNPHFPHTTSGVGTTKNCTDCHLSAQNDNNAIMTQLLGFGTGTVNFFGRYAYVGQGRGGFSAVVWTEAPEPQAAIGSHLQELAYPDDYQKHLAGGSVLREAYTHDAADIQDLTLRGEYLYTANGPAGFEVYDVAEIDQKGFSERTITAPVSPLGQRTYVRTKYATSVALPSTLGIDPGRLQLPENEEQKIDLFYAFAYITDLYEGLVVVNVATLVDGNPDNNFLKKDLVFNPGGILDGARFVTAAGHRLYICTPRGLVVVDVSNPMKPRVVGQVTGGWLSNPRAVAVQFRYLFVTDDEGLKVLDITDPEHPAPIKGATVRLRSANRLYLARTYAYVADGPDGLAIVKIENPEHPHIYQLFNAGGRLNDTRAVQIGSVNASMYALVADGKNGFRVLQMISPDTVPGAAGFSPPPSPRLIATFPTKHPAVAISRGLDRDRVVDETGGQTVVFGRRGSKPLNLADMNLFLRHDDGTLFKVQDVVMTSGTLTTRAGKPLPKPLGTPAPLNPFSPNSPFGPFGPLGPLAIPTPTPAGVDTHRLFR
jgi:hypothetical protein